MFDGSGVRCRNKNTCWKTCVSLWGRTTRPLIGFTRFGTNMGRLQDGPCTSCVSRLAWCTSRARNINFHTLSRASRRRKVLGGCGRIRDDESSAASTGRRRYISYPRGCTHATRRDVAGAARAAMKGRGPVELRYVA